MSMLWTTFPGSGQPLRVVIIDGEPWFATADVCKVLGRKNPSDAVKSLDPREVRTVNTLAINLASSEVNRVSAGGNSYHRGSPMLNLVSEAGLYTLIMRSDKPTARPFQEWVTGELIPSIRRGDTDVERQRERLRETVGQALGEGGVPAGRVVVTDLGLTVCTDGSVHCSHGEMVICFPEKSEGTGPPFGPYFRCPELERVGIAGSRAVELCERVKFVDLVRRLARPRTGPPPERTGGGLVLEFRGGEVTVRGEADELAELGRVVALRPAGEFAALLREFGAAG
ncbi:prophage antirepressor-like protein [Kitasatospora sp. MAP12-9]